MNRSPRRAAAVLAIALIAGLTVVGCAKRMEQTHTPTPEGKKERVTISGCRPDKQTVQVSKSRDSLFFSADEAGYQVRIEPDNAWTTVEAGGSRTYYSIEKFKVGRHSGHIRKNQSPCGSEFGPKGQPDVDVTP